MRRISTEFFPILQQALTHRAYLGAFTSSLFFLAVSILLQIILVPLYLSHLTTYQFGVLMMLLSFVNFAIIGIAWMSGGSLRLLGEYAGLGRDDDFRRAFGLIQFIYAGYGVVLAGLMALGAICLPAAIWREATPADIDAIRPAMIVTGIYMIAFYVASVDRLALTARKRQGIANIAQIFGLLGAGIAAWLFIAHGAGIVGVMIAQIAGAGISFAVTRVYLSREMSKLHLIVPRKSDMPMLGRLGGRTGFGFFIHGALVLLLSSDTVLIGMVGGAVAAAQFYLAWKIGEVIVQLIWKISESLAPYFVQMDVRGDHHQLWKIARVGYFSIGVLAFLAAIAYGFLGHYFVSLWVGPQQAPSEPMAYVLAGGAIFWLSLVRMPVVVAGARVTLAPMNIAGIVEFAAKWLTTFILFPRFGYMSLLIGINLAHSLFGASYLYFRLIFNRTPHQLAETAELSSKREKL